MGLARRCASDATRCQAMSSLANFTAPGLASREENGAATNRHGQNGDMTDAEFKRLRIQLRDTARNSAPPDEEAGNWVRTLDTAGGPDRWYDATLYYTEQAELLRRRGVTENQ